MSEIDAGLASDVKKLSALSPEQLGSLVDVILAFLLTAEAEEFMNSLAAYAGKMGIKAKTLRNSVRGLLVVFDGSLKNASTPAGLATDLEEFGISKDCASVAADKWRARLSELLRTQARKTLQVNKLVDMEWKFGVTTSSDEVAAIGATFLQLKLQIESGEEADGKADRGDESNGSGGGEGVGATAAAEAEAKGGDEGASSSSSSSSSSSGTSREDVHVQLSLTQFYNFLGEMEKANATLQAVE